MHDATVREVAYYLWQLRSIKGIKTTQEQDWYDAENIVRSQQKAKEAENTVDISSEPLPKVDPEMVGKTLGAELIK